jgi:HD-like signal output (HDOD) protein
MPITAVDYRERVKKGLSQLPPFSPVLNKLLASLAREDVPYSQLASIIEKDTVMSGNVLRLVNSAAYARRGEINSIPHAIAVLGLTKLRNVVLGLSISRMWASVKMPPSWSHARFNLHSVATAVMADNLAQHTDVNYPEGAFVAGLMHDVGKLLIAVSMPAEYQEVHDLMALGGRGLSDCEQEIIGASHGEISGIALEQWNLPVPIRQAAIFHHDPRANRQYDAEREGAKLHLAEVIQIADDTINRMGHSVNARPKDAAPADNPWEPAAAVVSTEAPVRLAADFEKEFEALRMFF